MSKKRVSSSSSSVGDEHGKELVRGWESLSREFDHFEEAHRHYLSRLEEIEKLKKEHRKEFYRIEQQMKKLSQAINKSQGSSSSSSKTTTKKKKKTSPSVDSPSVGIEGSDEPLQEIAENLLPERKEYLRRIQYTLPQSPERYLRVVLGSELPVSILDKSAQLKYKEGYEKFKLRVTLVLMFVSLLMSTVLPVNRALDALFHFLLVWYYCTLTIRESILVVNGSKIQFWWRLHHFLSILTTSIILIWPSTPSYQSFRAQHYLFSLYISVVQVLLYYYQSGLLYRLRALGDSDELQITIEGFHSWMLRGLTFLAPFLFLGYLFQFYNALVLFRLSEDAELLDPANPQWKWILKILSLLFFILFLGNFITMYSVIRRKIRQRIRDVQWLRHRYESVKTLLNRLRSSDKHWHTSSSSSPLILPSSITLSCSFSAFPVIFPSPVPRMISTPAGQI